MQSGKMLAFVSAFGLVTAPVVAQAAQRETLRLGSPVAQSEEMGGGSSVYILLGFAAALAAVIIIASDDDEESESP
jgi:hypothetical protein